MLCRRPHTTRLAVETPRNRLEYNQFVVVVDLFTFFVLHRLNDGDDAVGSRNFIKTSNDGFGRFALDLVCVSEAASASKTTYLATLSNYLKGRTAKAVLPILLFNLT